MERPLDNDYEGTEKRTQLMTEIVAAAFLLLVFLCLSSFFFFFLRFGDIPKKKFTDQTHPITGLSSALLPPFDVIVGNDDYRKLRAMPELKSVREMFWRERRRIVLMWLGELQKDVHILWKFRRFLVRNGLLVTFREEASVVFTGLFALLYLNAVQAAVFIFGPFALHGALGNARLLVERLSIWGEAAFARVPATRKVEIEQRWTQQLLAMGMRTG